MAMVYTLDEVKRRPALLAECGGKGRNLFRLQQLGLNVPPLVVLPFQSLQQLFPADETQWDSLTRENLPSFSSEQCTRTKADAAVLSQIQSEIKTQLKVERLLAVRSSVRFEDSAGTSFAGLFDTVLNVDIAQLETALSRCRASLFQPPMLEYALLKGISPAQNQLAVVVQEMVQASVSGVLFSMDASGNYNDLLVCCALGSGEGVVNNRAETTSYYLDRQNKSIRKRSEEPDLLRSDQLYELFDTALFLERNLAGPQDIEFSYDAEGKLFILQARPITTIQPEQLKIIDNTNIVESYPGITLPLSFTFARKAYQEVFTASARLFGLSDRTIHGLEPALSNMITHVQGRVYYNLHHWYRVMQLVLSSGNSLQAWETLIGVQSKSSQVDVSGWFKKLRTGSKALSLFFRYPRLVATFYRNFDREYAVFRAYLNNLPRMKPSAKEAFVFYQERSKPLFQDWSTTLLNDFFTFRFYDALTKRVNRLGFAPNETVANDLLCGIPGVESEQLVTDLLELAQHIQADPTLRRLFDLPDEAVLQQLPAELKARVDAFIDQYGDRTLEELKLETTNLRMDPSKFVGLLRSQLSPAVTAGERAARQLERRVSSEQKIAQRLARRWVFDWVLRYARETVRNRENMRLRRARAYGLAKELFVYIAGQMVSQGVLLRREDIFYWSMEQLEAYCLHGHVSVDLASVRTAFEAYSQVTPPDRMMFNGDEIPLRNLQSRLAASDGLLYGIGISTGTVEAECIVLSEPDFDQPVQGKILVTRMTDPAWVFLMTKAAGLISEKGSALSHTAIVGRELGLPVIIAATNATQILKTGMHIRMECSTGCIRILE